MLDAKSVDFYVKYIFREEERPSTQDNHIVIGNKRVIKDLVKPRKLHTFAVIKYYLIYSHIFMEGQ